METLGPYTLVEPLGQGSLADVFRAIRTAEGGAGAFVALKRLKPAFAAEEGFAAQYLSFARNVMPLNHPLVVGVLDAGQARPGPDGQGGGTYVVTQGVTGVPLNQVLNHLLTRNRDIPRAFALHVVGQVLEALGAAHSTADPSGRPILHGEMAPANVMVGMDGTVRVADFQLGRARHALLAPEHAPLRARFHYMAPEEVRQGRVDQRNDIYAVGVMLHEMLSFRRLRRGATPEEQRAQVEAGTWPTLASMGVPSDPGLDTVLSRALVDDPNQRYPTADAFLADVRQTMAAQGMALSTAQIASMMAGAFPQVLLAETTARAGVQAMPVPSPYASVGSAGPAQAPVADDATRPSRSRNATVRGDRGLKMKAALALAGLLVVTGGGVVGLRMMSRRAAISAVPANTEPTRDLSKLVGGRSPLFWSERLAQMDAAIAKARAQDSNPENPQVAALQARRADLLRKATALGLKELGDAPPPAALPAKAP